MPTATGCGRTAGPEFALRAVAWGLALFGALRLNWTEAHLLLPLTRVQARLAVWMFGTPALPVEATLACSGADALALCLAAILGYPVNWRTRLAGAGVGAALILGLNTVRIGTLARAAASPSWFDILHVYVWPAVLTLAIAGHVVAWMRFADRAPARPDTEAAPSRPLPAPLPSRRFVALSVVFLLLFAVASPFYLESSGVLALAGFIARAAAAILGAAGVSAHAAANVLWTPRGGFAVTEECLATPLIPIYLAGVCAGATTPRRLILGLLATVPLFTALGICRLLVVALPYALVASPLFVVHAFYQLLFAAVVVFLAAWRRHGGRAAFGRALLGAGAGVLFVRVLGGFYARAVTYYAGAPLDDPQGAIALLPAFQVGLYLALSVAAFVAVDWRRYLAGLAALPVTQTAGLLVLHGLASHAGLAPHVRDVRAWAVAAPVLIFAAVVNVARPRR